MSAFGSSIVQGRLATVPVVRPSPVLSVMKMLAT